MNSENQSKKKDGRGKPAGSKDTVNVSIRTLMEHAPQGLDTVIPVNRKWAKQFETFCNVKFIEAERPVKAILQETDLTEVAGEPESAVAIRPRLAVEEEIL